MVRRPEVVVFDVNETLSDMTPLRERFVAAGARADSLDVWFAATLRDAFALTVVGAPAVFPEVATGVLLSMLHGVADDPPAAAASILAGFGSLDVHPDVPDGMRLLADAGVRMVTLTNGSAAMAAKLFDRAGVADLVEARLSVDQIGRWKPAPEPYRWAAEQCGVDVAACAMVAVHPWDTDGAKRAGMATGWVDRSGAPYPGVFLPADATGPDLPTVVRALLALPATGPARTDAAA